VTAPDRRQQLSGRRIIVIGASRGIGAATVRAYAREGATVAALDLNVDGGEGTVSATSDTQGSARFFMCDVSSRASVDAAFAAATDWLGGLDVMVNAAGVEARAPAAEITVAEWDSLFAVNVRGTFLTNQAAFAYLRQWGGAIVNFGSDAGLQAYPDGAHYSASKGAVMSLTRTLSGEWGRYNIRVNAVLPAIWTPMYDEFRSRRTREELEEHDAEQSRRIPLGGRLGDPDRDLAPVMVFLAGEGARFITGQLISVNGGFVSVR
jgi:NAD(P)-dependent dehydrogenase (short-subunit alcohol dehydrogenase family)